MLTKEMQVLDGGICEDTQLEETVHLKKSILY